MCGVSNVLITGHVVILTAGLHSLIILLSPQPAVKLYQISFDIFNLCVLNQISPGPVWSGGGQSVVWWTTSSDLQISLPPAGLCSARVCALLSPQPALTLSQAACGGVSCTVEWSSTVLNTNSNQTCTAFSSPTRESAMLRWR